MSVQESVKYCACRYTLLQSLPPLSHVTLHVVLKNVFVAVSFISWSSRGSVIFAVIVASVVTVHVTSCSVIFMFPAVSFAHAFV